MIFVAWCPQTTSRPQIVIPGARIISSTPSPRPSRFQAKAEVPPDAPILSFPTHTHPGTQNRLSPPLPCPCPPK